MVAAHLPSQPRPVHQKSKDDGALYSLSSATTLLPGQDKLAPFCPMSGESCFVVSCGVRLSELGSGTVRKPQVARSIRVAGSTLHKTTSSKLGVRITGVAISILNRRPPHTASRMQRPLRLSLVSLVWGFLGSVTDRYGCNRRVGGFNYSEASPSALFRIDDQQQTKEHHASPPGNL